MSNTETRKEPDKVEKASELDRAQSKSININRMASFGAVLISSMALGVSILEVNAMKAQQRAMTWPFVCIKNTYSSDGFKLLLENKGVGPAVVANVDITYQGQSYRNLDALIINTVGEDEAFGYDVYRGSNPSGSVIAAGEEVTLFSVPWEERTEKLLAAWDNSVIVSACYCSIQDDCWVSRLGQNMAEKVKTCTYKD